MKTVYPTDNTYPQYFLFPNLSYILRFIVDREQYDVDLVNELNDKMINRQATDEEVELWMSDLKGALNKSDLIRVEEGLHAIKHLFASNLDVDSRTIPDLPFKDYYNSVLSDVNKVNATQFAYNLQLNTPTAPLTTFEKWNVLETILFESLNTFTRNTKSYNYSGNELYASNDALL